MTQTAGYLDNHPKSHLQCWSNQIWLRPRVTDEPFSEAGKFSKTILLCLGKVWQWFFLYFACPVWTLYIFSVVEAWAVLCPKTIFYPKKKTSSKWSFFSAQHSLRNKLVLPGEIMSHINRTLSYLSAIFYSSLKQLQITVPGIASVLLSGP